MKLYVGNIPHSMSESDLTSEFKEYGAVQSLKIITDRETGRSRGFGFVEMADSDGRKAIEALNNAEMLGRRITVNIAQDRR